MKNSKKVLIGALLAASTLVGATVATYVVTDNANAVGIKVTPGTLTAEGKVTLSWGENSVANVSNLSLGGVKQAGELILKAEHNTEEAYEGYNGLLNIALEDLTTRDPNYSGAKFIDYLDVYLFSKEDNVQYSSTVMPELIEANGYIGKIPTEQEQLSYDFAALGTPEGKHYVVYVSLNASASSVYGTIKTDIVYVTFNWNKASGDQNEAASNKVYFYDPNGEFGTTPYIYAFKDNKISAEWPGEAMTKISDGLFSYDLSRSFNTIIFNNNNNGKQTADISVALNDSDEIDAPYFTLGALDSETNKYAVTPGSSNPATLANYYITGEFAAASDPTSGWYGVAGFIEGNEMGAGDEQNYAIKEHVQLTEGDRFKIVGKDGAWYDAEESGSRDSDGNWLVTATGAYTIYLNNNGNIWAQLEA